MIKHLKYIAISLVLLSNLCGQKELNGVWVDNENKVFTYPTMQTTGYEIFKGKSSQFVKEWRITCKILDNKIEFKEQNHNEASYADKIEKTEGQIKWNETAEKIIGKINGLYPSPGAFFIFKG